MDVVEQAAIAIFRVFLAEHWARFYYAVEQDGVVSLAIPEEVLTALASEDAGLADFLGGLNGKPLSEATSRRAVGEHVFRTMEGGTYPQGTVAKAFDSTTFGLSMRLFSLWLTGNEAMLDEKPLPIAQWERLFAAWRQDPAVVRFAESLVTSGNPEAPASDAVN